MQRYRAASADTLRPVRMDGLTLIYHRASGITHVVASPAPEILAALADAPLTPAELMATLAQNYALDAADGTALAARLDELVAAGLVAAA